MCLVSLALDQSSRFPFVLASNRDEFFERPAARLGWWEPEHGGAPILGGRDLHAGGTWLGLTAQGRLGLVTNIRNPKDVDPAAPSRGDIVPLWLRGDRHMSQLWPQLALSGYNGFNMLAVDFLTGECFWLNNRRVHPERLQKGVYGLSNAELNTPWPKVSRLKSAMKSAISQADDSEDLANRLLTALADPAVAHDAELPETGVPLALERALSAPFIRTADNRYGTRCSTVVVTERVNKRLVTHVLERTYSASSSLALMRRVTLKNWPPRHTMGMADVARIQATLPVPPSSRATDEAFESSEVQEQDNHALSEVSAIKRTRARSLIKSS